MREEAYAGSRLSSQRDDQARRFLSDPRKLRIEREGRKISGIPGPGVVHLSPIFRWFANDFKPVYAPSQGFGRHSDAEKAALSYISRHLADADRRTLERGDYTIEYLDYDWSLNEGPSR